MRRAALALLLSLVVSSAPGGCRQEQRDAPRRDPVDARSPDAAVHPKDALAIEWRPVVKAVSRAVVAATRVGAALRAALVRDVAGLCRLDGWNQERTIGYRERGWRLKRRTGPARTRRLVLTFDDGPMKKKTPRILDLLAKHKVKATFFVVGRVIHAGTYRLVRRILKEGHTLANHSYHHLVDMHKHEQAAALIEAELELTQAMVDLALLARSWRDFRALRIRMVGGKQLGFAKALPAAWPAIRARWREILWERRPDGQSPHRMIFVRPPGGAPFSTRWRRHHRRQYARIIRKLGLINVMWDEDSGDSDTMLTSAERRDSDRLVDAILEGTKRGGVFLMHDRIGLGGFGQALRQVLARRRVVLIDLPAAARSWYGCEARTLSLVLQTLHALAYRAPEPPAAKNHKPAVRRRRQRRVRKRRGSMPRRR
jgi:peptidoglycan/xylan/chitin deacetylase (PgdA/CDA1 family)